MIKNAIKNIILGKNLTTILETTLNRLYMQGPISVSDLEILSYFAKYQSKSLEPYLDRLLWYMGMYYKLEDKKPNSLKELVLQVYSETIKEKMGVYYTPVQAHIVGGIDSNNCYSFSAPTSAGKSFVFRKLISECVNDVVVFVPSRALINEYYLVLNDSIRDKSVNILTFVDKINTSRARRSIFILTPERCSDLFKRSGEFVVDLFLFDEAQLGNEHTARGLYYDSVIRRAQKYFPSSKCVFAHPFVANPEVQITKNHFNPNSSSSDVYRQRTVGQLYYSLDKTDFYHIGVDKGKMGNKHRIYHDPIEETLLQGGIVLFYVPKSHILSNSVYTKYKKYIDMCGDLEEKLVRPYQDRIHKCTGGTNIKNKLYYSSSLDLIKKGVVIHHGSLPLKARAVIEDFIKAKHCRICFATSTLEQGINMPFDLIFIERFEKSKPLAVKNLIGRAGRSTSEMKFDYGKVVIKQTNVSSFRNIMSKEYSLSDVSLLEDKNNTLGDDFEDFKQSILNGTFIEDFNMTEKQYQALTTDEIQDHVKGFLDYVFVDEKLLGQKEFYQKLKESPDNILVPFIHIYESHLGRMVTAAEKKVLCNAIHILFLRIYFKQFGVICRIRYDLLCKTKIRRELESKGKDYSHLRVSSMMGYSDLPNKSLNFFNLVDAKTAVTDVDFDTIVYDTYDYLDKLIGFKLADIFCAAFMARNNNQRDIRALKFANLIKFGTCDEKEINLLRYGLSIEEVHELLPFIESVDAEGISVKKDFYTIPEESRRCLDRFIDY